MKAAADEASDRHTPIIGRDYRIPATDYDDIDEFTPSQAELRLAYAARGPLVMRC